MIYEKYQINEINILRELSVGLCGVGCSTLIAFYVIFSGMV